MSSSKDEKRRAVPKFASFRPKPTPEPVPAQSRPSSDKETVAIKDDKHTSDRHRHQHHRHHERRTSASPHARDRTKDTPPPPAPHPRPQSDSHEPPANDLFFFDKRGDPLILRYGSNERSRVPSYRRFGAGKLMGSSSLLSMHRDGARDEFSIRGYREGAGSAFRDKNLILASASRSRPKLIRPGAQVEQPTGSEDFVALEPPRKRRRGGDSELVPDEDRMPDYRSIHGMAKAGEDSETDDASESEDESLEERRPEEMTVAKKRSIELSRQVRDHPEDTGSWLALIGLQDTLFKENENGDGTQPRGPDAVRGLAELKLSLYEEALPRAAKPSDREKALEGMMREGEKVWDPKTLAKRWDDVTKKDGGHSFTLWKARLNYELSHMSAVFTLEEIRNSIVDELQRLSKSLSEHALEVEDTAVLCGQLIYVFLRLTRFLHDTGYSELAVAAWQSMLEMSFSRPADADDPQLAMASFADFWESEAPRMGEEGANGWRNFVEADTMPEPPEPKQKTKPETQRVEEDVFKAWVVAEENEEEESRMPARTLDEGTEHDPFRIVMFSDIQSFLAWIPRTALSCARPRLLDAFLTFCRLPTAGLSSSDRVFTALLHDPFVTGPGQAFELSFAHEAAPNEASSLLEVSKKAPEFRQQGGNMALSQDVLFPGAAWFQYLGNWSDMQKLGRGHVDSPWILGTLRHLVRVCGLEKLAEYYLAAEWRNDCSAARKVAKGLLKQYGSARLYNAYASIEWASQNAEVAEKVLSSATRMPSSSVANDQSQLLWNTWTWMHLESSQKQTATARLCSSVDSSTGPELSTTTPPALLLKARSHFSSTRDYSLSFLHLERATQHAESLALLEYLTAEPTSETEPASESQGNINAALASIRGFSRELNSLDKDELTAYYQERILQTAARLLYYHATHGPYRPVYLREQLKSFIDSFPQNILFLELFAWAESGVFRIDDPVRAMLQTVCLAENEAASHDCISSRRFAIQYEVGAGTANSTRLAFEAALASEACRGNVEIWLCYLRFTHHREEGERRRLGRRKGNATKQTKDVFYRAVSACPWSRRLYMGAFGDGGGDGRSITTSVVEDMSSSELRAVFNTMTTRGLRVHVDLDEFTAKWQAGRRGTTGAERR
ncbi:NRDE-2, necessary for RNA interference-domain-containing protein [Podospora appendiculata]|uniref:NRDE-2, necessary for RNA interference-domain-containing protein n=1 Tax=Podospora appendiculata TaxID=314037 RepID=A0AAE1CFN9_9PEZI|nr:NRDE-2, necessary for RNA interference-domain-containing protein [Podospora appendiculata]